MSESKKYVNLRQGSKSNIDLVPKETELEKLQHNNNVYFATINPDDNINTIQSGDIVYSSTSASDIIIDLSLIPVENYGNLGTNDLMGTSLEDIFNNLLKSKN